MMKLEWENLESTDGDHHCRAKIPGGWLYKSVSSASTTYDDAPHWDHEWRSSICFVPDKDER